MRTSRGLALAAGPLVLAALTGCSGSSAVGSSPPPSPPSSPAAPVPGPTTSSPAAPTTALPSSTSTAPATALAGPARDCTGSQLSVRASDVDGGLGHSGEVVVFTNTGGQACSLRAYPGVAGVTSTGGQAAQARRVASGYLFQVRTVATVRLAPGGTASAGVETDDPAKQGQACTRLVGLLVTPPNETHSVRVTAAAGCAQPGLQVHPVVSGATGKD